MNYEGNLRFNYSSLGEFHEKMNKIIDTLNEQYKEAKNILDDIQGDTQWKQEAKKTLVDYLQLSVEYHGAHVGKYTKGEGGNPAQDAKEANQDLRNHLDSFYDNSEAYRKLND